MTFFLYPLIYMLAACSSTQPATVHHTAATPPVIDMDYLVAFYKERHMHPEISLHEEETGKALAAELEKVGYDVTTNVGGHGVVAILKNGNGPTVLYRTDTDALPMAEKTGLTYKSTVDSEGHEAMHSCGHDMHMTTWVGTAQAMAASKDEWSGTLMFIGQPAEEIGMGSKAMLEDGLYDRFGVPDYGFGLHCSPNLKSGQVSMSSGYSMANTESIDIKIKGIGAHGASPHKSIDPVVIASMIVMDIQTIVSRNLDPLDNAVITVGSIHGGTKHNIIGDEVHLQLTVRTYKEKTRKYIHRRLKEIAEGVAMAAGLSEELMPEVIIPDVFTPANYNDDALTKMMKASAAKAIGQNNVLPSSPLMVGEDFSRYGSTAHDVPTVLYWLGTVTQDKIDSGDTPGLHSPFYYPEIESTIRTGITVNTQILKDILVK